MQYEERQLIDGLFQRLKQTEQQHSARDADAERQIEEFVRQQPAAPYYMAQSILIQEAALKRLQARVQELESELAAQKSKQPVSSGGFLSGLFGGAKTQSPQPESSWNSPPQTMPDAARAAAPRSGSFMSGALQTAAGVAGGVVLADMLTSMFHHSRPEEIVNIIEEPIDPGAGMRFDAGQNDAFNNVSDSRFLGNDDPYRAGSDDGYLNDGDFDNSDYSNDDDSFI